ncbi:MAG: dolichyl-diphosphooligosaccharide--protein glycosyltransferase subunit 1 [Candidatus Bathyarchaeota archaeon]|nr:dolichyl-diphosphooligosaccharide--protein glycosyltransferase subunit 1 [Candidatus Bathyarchaeota archaeon]MDH5732328.1 dolichyl-diphosphooligosaccharide--protein glycosyltransferase subunit 1 [Candidatus Bathyarchaeota archaeon]
MKKRRFQLVLILVFFVSLQISASLGVNATTNETSLGIQVDHTFEIQNGGLVILEENFRLTNKHGEDTVLLQNFTTGFPFEYGSNLDGCFAYSEAPYQQLDLLHDVGLGKIGFYGTTVKFPNSGIPISINETYSFAVVFVFSDLISVETSGTPDELWWNFTFPLFPSLPYQASECSVTIILPDETTYIDSLLTSRGSDFGVTNLDSHQTLNFTENPLEKLAYAPSWLIFRQSTILTPDNPFHLIDANEINREITLDEWGRISLSESYYLENKGLWNLTEIEIHLPQGVHEISARDESGDLQVVLAEGNATVLTNATIQLRGVIRKNQEAKFTVTYYIPWKGYIDQYSLHNFNWSFAFLERQYFNWPIRKLTTTFILPEGAKFLQLPAVPENLKGEKIESLQRDVFQEVLTYTFYNVTPFHELDFNLTYDYFVFWASFRPTLWIGVIVLVISVVALLWKVPRPTPISMIPVPSKDLRSFVDTYGKKTSLLLELETLEQQLKRSKIRRRRYRIRRKAIEGRLSVLSRDLSSLREKIRAAGTRYANVMRQIEIAETELEGTETDIRRVGARYRRGEISKGAYNRLLGEYHRRRERAKVTIDGVLLRLQEEIR